ncbi:S-ribosylhomocysteine lyase [Castellaniella sp.]|uniref:S-ribosylhomocysteine lyase n=1 Tax=Castellaniella sp. TaxID=1955812 RepID=UPI003568C311
MNGIETLGWRADCVGELDHRQLKAPSVKLRGVHQGVGGDAIYSIDLRLRRPNADEYLTSTEAHSLEHFLLEGFQRLLPQQFIGVGVMGCQTGFYLNLLNEGRRERVETLLERILRDVLEAKAVPYANVTQCGRWQNHDLASAQAVAREVLAARDHWGEIA